MKNIILVCLCFAFAKANLSHAQKKVDLDTYAPKNPQPYMLMAPVAHNYVGDVVRVDKIWQSGKVLTSSHYNRDGVLDSISTNDKINEYSFDKYTPSKNEQGLIIEESRSESDGDESKRTYSYYASGLLKTYTKWKRKQVRKGVYRMVEDDTRTYEYDEVGRLIKEDDYVFKYTVEGKKLTIDVMEGDKQSFQYVYDRYGDLISTTSYWTQTPKVTNFTYVRDKKGNVIYNFSDVDQKISDVKKFYYKDGTVSTYPHDDITDGLVIKDNGLYWNGFKNEVSISQGFYEKGKLNGLGWLVDYGTRWEGNFKDGKLNGYGMIQDLSKFETFISGTFKDGLLDGRGMTFENGSPVEAGIYKKGKLIESNDITAALSDETTCKEKETCPDGFQRKKEQGYNTYSYSFFKNGKPIGPSFMTNRSINAHAYSDENGLLLFNGEINKIRVLASYKDNAMNGLGYFSQGKQYKAGVFENNELKKSLIK
ncbi:MAG: hypothetical protein ACSHWW_10090 [Nonlabens sp.]|uniref:hypothetical protein n=1 Tax=Nonlabens sp. TaxID=1888209 RepID=UPI003EF18616